MLDTTMESPENINHSSHTSTVLSLHDIQASNEAAPPVSNLFSFFQLNCHVSKSVTLTTLELSTSFDFLILQEPWVNPFDMAPLQHPAWRAFSAFEHTPSKWQDRHKSVIYIKKSIPSNLIKLLPGGSQVVVGVEVTPPMGQPFRFLNIYNPPSSLSAIPELKGWLTKVYSRQIATFICMDSNVHHKHWNPPGRGRSDAGAIELLSMLSPAGFRLASPRHVPTFFSSKGKGFTLDLVWANFLGS